MPAVAPPPPPGLRQERWHMLDGVAGKINLTIKAKLDRFNEISAQMADPDADFDTLHRKLVRC